MSDVRVAGTPIAMSNIVVRSGSGLHARTFLRRADAVQHVRQGEVVSCRDRSEEGKHRDNGGKDVCEFYDMKGV